MGWDILTTWSVILTSASVILTTGSIILTPESADNIIMLLPLVSCQNCSDYLRQARYTAFHNWSCNRERTGITWHKFAHYYHVIMSSWGPFQHGYKFNWVISLASWKWVPVNSKIWSLNKFLHFADDIFKFIFINVNHCILIQMSLKFSPTVQLTMHKLWFRWLGNKHVTNHYLNQ